MYLAYKAFVCLFVWGGRSEFKEKPNVSEMYILCVNSHFCLILYSPSFVFQIFQTVSGSCSDGHKTPES